MSSSSSTSAAASTESLLRWLSTCFHRSLPSASAVSDGAEIAAILHTIDSRFFSTQWKSKVRDDIPADNKRLKSSNVKKVLSGMQEYFSDVLNIQLQDFPMPDCNKVSEVTSGNGGEDVARLLQLVMGCAVNCDNKGVYIEAIMSMEEEDQRVIMQAIQELMEFQAPQSEPSLPALSPTDVKKMMDELAESKREKDDLRQRLHDMEQTMNAVKNEKASVASELEQLQAQVRVNMSCT